MLLNKIIICILISLFFYSCAEKKDEAPPLKDYDNPAVALDEAKNILGENTKFAYNGVFDKDTAIELAAGTEISNKDVWGIKFQLLKQKDNKFQKVFESDLLNGSFKGSITKKIKFPAFDYELVYYNSSDYFLGSGVGEVFSYIIDFKERKIYYAHLIQSKGISLFLSKNMENSNIKDFYISLFRKDYPELKLVTEDINLMD